MILMGEQENELRNKIYEIYPDVREIWFQRYGLILIHNSGRKNIIDLSKFKTTDLLFEKVKECLHNEQLKIKKDLRDTLNLPEILVKLQADILENYDVMLEIKAYTDKYIISLPEEYKKYPTNMFPFKVGKSELKNKSNQILNDLLKEMLKYETMSKEIKKLKEYKEFETEHPDFFQVNGRSEFFCKNENYITPNVYGLYVKFQELMSAMKNPFKFRIYYSQAVCITETPYDRYFQRFSSYTPDEFENIIKMAIYGEKEGILK